MTLGDILKGIVDGLPLPQTVFEGTWFFVGWMAGDAFGGKCDEDLLAWIDLNVQGKWKKWIMKLATRTLNFIHHAWIGLLGVVYFGILPVAQSVTGVPVCLPVTPCGEAFWFFMGLALEDIQYHIRASATDGILSMIVSALKTK